jgi:uncharacterized GH25 family protein
MINKISAKTIAAALVIVLFLVCAGSAAAHNALLLPSKTTVEVGESVEITASISEPLGVPDMPFIANESIGYVYGPLHLAAFEDGKATNLKFGYFNVRNGARQEFTYDEIAAAFTKLRATDPDASAYSLMVKILNANVGTYKIASRGTVTFAGVSSYGTDSKVKCLMKTFVNLKKDGESAKPRAAYFGFDGIELCPIDDLAKARPGRTIRVQAFLNGKPQSGVVVYSGYKDLEESNRVSPILEYSEKADPILDAGVTGIDGIVELAMPRIPRGSKELKDVYIFTDGHLAVEGVRYRSTINFTLK